MERKVYNELVKWKSDASKRILLLYGARQIGKTYSVIEFGKSKYRNIVYFDMNNNNVLINLFKTEKILDKIVLKLSMLSNESIFCEDSLIVFDNCQDIDFMRSLKIFYNDLKKYDVVCITANSSLINKVKGEEFRYCSMYSMDFEEYLLNSDKKQLIDFIKDSYHTLKPMPFHQMALDAYYDYLTTGGFPEVILNHFKNNDDLINESIKQKILNVYISDVIINNDDGDIKRCLDVINSLPMQLQKENRKFQYGMIKKGGRSKEYENSINFLANNYMINRCYRLSDVKVPLSSFKDSESFKLYVNDSGLLFTMLHLNKMRLMTDEDTRRCIIENNIANMIVRMGHSLCYYQSDGKAEVSFILQNRVGKIIPLEIVNNKLTKAKSLSLFLAKYELDDSIRITEENFNKKKCIRYIPIYASFCLKDF